MHTYVDVYESMCIRVVGVYVHMFMCVCICIILGKLKDNWFFSVLPIYHNQKQACKEAHIHTHPCTLTQDFNVLCFL